MQTQAPFSARVFGLMLLATGLVLGGLMASPTGAMIAAQPTRAPTATLTLDQDGLARQFAEHVGPAPGDLEACDAEGITESGRTYNLQLIDAVAHLLADPDAPTLDFDRLAAIAEQGVEYTFDSPYHRAIWPVIFYESKPDAILAYVGYSWCSFGSHYLTPWGGLVVFSPSGEYWHLGDVNYATAQRAASGWIVEVDVSPTTIAEDRHIQLWQVVPGDDGEWTSNTVDAFFFPAALLDFEVDAERLTVRLEHQVEEPPCQFIADVSDSLYVMWGQSTRVYEFTDGALVPGEEVLDVVHVYVRVDGSPAYAELKDWQAFCVDPAQ